MDPVANRIIELIELLQLSPTEFADQCNIKRPVLSHILSGRNNPSLMVIQHILESFTNVNPYWLLLGLGESFTNVVKALNEKNVSQKTEYLEKPILSNNPALPTNHANEVISETPEPSNRKQGDLTPPPSKASTKKVRQIVMFYDDGTFESFQQIPVAPTGA